MDYERPAVRLTTDGACKGNPGPGGWAAILFWNGSEKILSGAEAVTTNNRMELLAVIRGLEALKRAARVTVESDSRYVIDGMTRWLAGWQRNGWRNARKEAVKNADLWQALQKAAAAHDISWQWVRGHAGHPRNERADQLANEAIRQQLTGG